MTFLWEPNSANYGSSKRILTHVFQNHYNGPFGSKDAMIPYKTNIEYNLDHRCVSLQNWAQDQADTQVNKENVIVLYGDDFTFENSFMSYKYLERLINYCNNEQRAQS